MKHRIDSTRLTLLRQERGLASRELALDCGIDIAVLRRLETSPNPGLSTLSLAQFLRIADRLNVPAGTLLTTEHEDTAPPNDTALLGALLTELATHTQTLIIAEALGWDIPRVHTTADALETLLRPTGMTIYRDSGRISLRPLDDQHQAANIKVKQDPRLPYTQRVLTAARLKKVHRALHGHLNEHSVSETDRRDIAVLKRAGTIDDTDTQITVTDDVLRSLYPEGPPG